MITNVLRDLVRIEHPTVAQTLRAIPHDDVLFASLYSTPNGGTTYPLTEQAVFDAATTI